MAHEILDDIDSLVVYDEAGIGRTLTDFSDQIEAGFETIKNYALPASLAQVEMIAVCAVGDPLVAAQAATLLANQQSEIPVVCVADYQLPQFINHKALVIAISYSGNSDEVNVVVREAVQRRSKILAISTGGGLAALSRQYRFQVIPVEYGGEARGSLPIILALLLGLFHKIGAIDFPAKDQLKIAALLKSQQATLKPVVPVERNLAKQTAKSIDSKTIICLSHGILNPVARRLVLDINQNSRLPVLHGELPDFSHNGLSGLERISNPDQWIALIFESPNDFIRIEAHLKTAKEQIKKIGIESIAFSSPARISTIAELLMGIQMVDYISYYFALANKTKIFDLVVARQLKEELAFLRGEVIK